MIDIDEPYAVSNSITRLGFGVLVATVGTATTLGGSPSRAYPAANLSEQIRPWESSLLFLETEDTVDTQRWQAVLTEFAERLIEETIEPIPEFDAVISEHFWNLA